MKPTLFFLDKKEETKKENPAVQRDGLGWLFSVDFSGVIRDNIPHSYRLICKNFMKNSRFGHPDQATLNTEHTVKVEHTGEAEDPED